MFDALDQNYKDRIGCELTSVDTTTRPAVRKFSNRAKRFTAGMG